ncbi:MAG: CDP-alcohol phosphatidyltransferase family protein [Actinomycetota bacterium]
MLNKLFGAVAHRLIVPLVSGLVRLGLSANLVTVVGFLITVAAAAVVAGGRLFAGGLVLLIGAGFDMLDGAVARASGGGSDRGAFLDSTLDRLSDAAVFLGAAWWLAGAENRLGVSLALGAMVLALMVSYVRARAEGLGFTCRVGLAERPERVVIMAVGLLFDQLVPALALLAAASALTVAQRFLHVWKQAA